jgi:Na+/proline symporter
MIVDYFLSGYWQRAFSSKTDRDLWIGCIAAACIVFTFLSLVGVTGLLAVWGGIVTDLENEASYSFFLLLATMKPWVIGFVLVFTISLSCAAYDTLQTALVATISKLVYMTSKYVEIDEPSR